MVSLILMLTVAGISLVAMSTAQRTLSDTQRRSTWRRLEAQATTAMEMLAQSLWLDFTASQGGPGGNLAAFRTFLDNASPKLPNGLADSTVNPGALPTDLLGQLGFPVAADGFPRLGNTSLGRLTVQRFDRTDRTDLEVVAMAQTGADARADRREVRQVVSVAGELFEGFEFSLLSNNVNCIMCHARFDSAVRYYNRDPAAYGTFPRVRVGTMESLLLRVGKADSIIGGTLYVRGVVTDKKGDLLTNLAGSTLRGHDFDAAGNMIGDSTGALTEVELYAASMLNPQPLENLYMDYAVDPIDQVDGPMPNSFPAPIPDTNGNRQVDAAEFQELATVSTGSVDGGIIYAVGSASQYSGSLPSAGNRTQISGSTNDNVILIGTPTDPIDLSGNIAVDGDLVIAGTVKGDGALFASGNIYVLGDLKYADGVDSHGDRTFGVAQDGTTNALALAAGGNVLIGDYVSSRADNAVTGDGSGDFNFTMSEVTLFNRGEWTRTQPSLPDSSGKLVANPLYDPNHIPRYYTHGNGDPVLAFNKAVGTQHYFDASTATWKGKEHINNYDPQWMSTYQAGSPEYDGAALSSLGSRNNWLPEGTLRSMWKTVESSHPTGPMEIDALVYTNNSAWALVRRSSKYAGQLTLNGALVAADTGVLAAGGLQLNYDQRLKSRLTIRDAGGPAAMVRSLWSVSSSH